MSRIYLLIAALFMTMTSFAQFAQVQVIHNSPSPTVDVYANGILLLDDFAFRDATAFAALPAGIPLNLAVAPDTSTSAASALVTFEGVTFELGGTYVVTAGGIVGNPDTPFELMVNDMAKTQADDPGLVELSVLHGSPNAPAVDVDVRTGGTIIESLAYGEYSEYLAVPPGVYYLDVRAAGDPNIVATFQADLSGLAGGAATVFASGLLGGDPAFGLFAALPNGDVVELPAVEVARVQLIHNSPSPTVDIYANGDLLLDDFAFRDATPFQFLPAGVGIDIAVAPDTSTSAASALVTFEGVTFENGSIYVVTAGGIVGNADTPFTLQVNNMGKEAADDPATVEVAVLHGSPNAPAVDVDARTIGTVITNLSYGEYTGYLALDPAVYYLDVRAAGDPNIVATFQADLSGLAGGAATVFASGLLGGDPAFGLFAALPNGDVVELPAVEVARVQLIHNSPEPTVDIYANGDIFLDDFEFQSATPFVYVPAGVEIDFAVAPDTSTSAASALVTFENIVFDNGETYVVIANGIVGNAETPFELAVFDAGRERSEFSDGVDILAFHGSPGAPAVDINDFLAPPVFIDLAYGEFQGYLPLAAEQYFFEVVPSGSTDVVGTFGIDLTPLAGGAAVVFASGILGGDTPFDLLAALPDGTVVPLIPYSLVQVIHNSPAEAAETVDLWVANFEVKLLEDVSYRSATPIFFLRTRLPFELGVAPADSDGPEDIIATVPEVTLQDGESYILIANGIPGDADFPFEIVANTGLQVFSDEPGQVDLAVFHGSPGAPAVDVEARDVAQLIDGLAYGELEPYATVPPAQYYLEITPDDSDDLVATFDANISGLAGFSAIAVATGILGDEPPFDIFVVLPTGAVIDLTSVARVQVIHNSPDPTVDIYINGGDEPAISDFAFRTATPFIDLPTRTELDIAVAPGNSSSAADALDNFPVTLEDGKSYIVMATGIVGDADTPFTLAVNDMARERAATGTGVDLLLYHGSPDAPEVDVVVAGGSVLFDNTEYGEYNGYVNVPAGSYELQITPANDNDQVVRAYIADINALDGGAATVFASGFLSEGEPVFEVWVALPDGTTFPLEATSSGDLADLVSTFALAPNPAREQSLIRYTLEEPMEVTFQLYDALGQLIRSEYRGRMAAGEHNQQLALSGLDSGVYYVSLVSDQGTVTRRLVVTK